MANPNTLTKDEVDDICYRSIRGYDKWNRMFNGISSSLERYENGIIYLDINNSESTYLSTHDTAVAFARSWIRWNKELEGAQGFVVAFYKNGTTGAMLNNTPDVAHRLAAITQALVAEDQKPPVLVALFSGLLMENPARDSTKAPRAAQTEADVVVSAGGDANDEEEISFAQHQRVRNG